MATRDDSTEIRLDAPNPVVTVLDGVSLAHNLTRNQLVLRILKEWADLRILEASLLHKVGAVTPQRAENDGKQRG